MASRTTAAINPRRARPPTVAKSAKGGAAAWLTRSTLLLDFDYTFHAGVQPADVGVFARLVEGERGALPAQEHRGLRAVGDRDLVRRVVAVEEGERLAQRRADLRRL